MLRKETITPKTLELLNDLMRDEKLRPFFLVGGTALSLQIGHRISIDIDLFSQQHFDENDVSAHLEIQWGLQLNYLSKNTIKGEIEGIQVDLIRHGYPLVRDILIEDGIRLSSLEDIAAMKLNAIVGNGTRLKDFIDIAYLSSYLSLDQMMNAYEHKYQTRNPLMTMKSLAYHDEINFNEPIRLMTATYSWKLIESRLNQMIENPDKVLSGMAG